MRAMRRNLAARLAAAAVLVPVSAVLAPPAAAAPATHDVWTEEYDATEAFAAGEHPCVEWAGTFREVRSGSYRLLWSGGHGDGELHVNGVVHGSVELVPDEEGLPTYTGTYREKLNAVVLEVTEEGDALRVGQYRLRGVLEGSDGSTLTLTMSGKMTTTPSGRVVVSRDHFSCA